MRLGEGNRRRPSGTPEIGFATREALSLLHSSVKESAVAGLEAALAFGDRDTVNEILEIVRADPIGRAPFYRAHASRIEARAPDRSEDEAERLFTSSIGAFREIGFPFWMAVTLLEHGERLDARGRGSDAGPLVAEARSIFERLGARPWLDRADRVVQASQATA